MNSPPDSKLLVPAAAGTVALLIACSFWFYAARSRGQQSLDWQPVTARVIKNDAAQSGGRGFSGFETTIANHFAGREYEKTIREYRLGNIEIYVNPERPDQITTTLGGSFTNLIVPLIGIVVSLLFGFFLILILISPSTEETSDD